MTRFYLCHLPEKTAIQYGAVPETWGSISGMLDLDEAALSDLTWAGYPEHAFLTDAAARALGIGEGSLLAAYDIAGQVEMTSVRAQRDALLAVSDIAVMSDRWAAYTKVQRQAWTDYRTALRDLPSTVTDPFNVTWPTAPVAQ